MEEESYCIKCGKKLAPGAQFCQYCGQTVEGSPADLKRKEEAKQFEEMVKESKRTWILFLLALYAIPATIISVYVLTDANTIANMVWNNSDVQSWLTSHPDVTFDTVLSYVTYVGGMIAGSAVCALISLVCCYLRKFWILAVITCFIAAFLCIFSLFGMIVGIFVAWMIISAKDSFVTAPKAAKN